MKKEFKLVAGWIMSVLGIQNFAKDNDGKLHLTAEQEATLTEKYGSQFVSDFKANLEKMSLEDGKVNLTLSAEERLELDASRKETAELKARIENLLATEKAMKATIAKLEKEAADGDGKKVTLSEFEQKAVEAGVDLTLKHNRVLVDHLQGKVSAAYSGDSTIDTSELKKEFGKYVSSERLEILRRLFGQTESTKYMSTIITDKTEVRAQQANIIGNVLQQFVPEWTPSGKAKFTPLVIKNFKLKLNVPIKPSDIMEDILGYMYDEQAAQLQSMPIVRYILWQLVFPKLQEEREKALALGRFKEVEPDENGKYPASDPMDSMDGYLTQLIDWYNGSGRASKAINFLKKGEAIDMDNLMDEIDGIVDEIAEKYPNYAGKQMYIHCDPNFIIKYQRDYRAHYPWTKNEDGENRQRVDFSKFTFAPMEGMRGTNCFFLTPKENFKHLMSQDPQRVTLRFQESDYDVKIFGEWWEGTGFWMGEAIFAYIDPTAAETYKAPAEEDGGGDDNQDDGGEGGI